MRRRSVRLGIPIALVLLAVMYESISYLMASGVTKAERKALETSPASYGLEFEDVEFPSRNSSLTLSGWYIEGEPAQPTIIIVHGHNRNRESNLELASRLAGRDFSIMLFDLRGHGRSGGQETSGGYHERWDLLGAFDFLMQRGVQAEKVGVLGFSMGAATALLGVAEEPAIRAVVADSSYADISDLIAQETARETPFPEWIVPVFVPGMDLMAGLFFDVDIGAMIPQEAVARLDYPVLLVHGTADERIPVDSSVRIHLASHPDSSLWLVNDVGHTDAFDEHPDEYVEKVVSYFESRLVGE